MSDESDIESKLRPTERDDLSKNVGLRISRGVSIRLCKFSQTSVILGRMITRMKAERVRRGWTQAELATKAGLKGPEISRIESGRMKPYPTQVARLSKVLKLEMFALLDLVPDPRPGYEGL